MGNTVCGTENRTIIGDPPEQARQIAPPAAPNRESKWHCCVDQRVLHADEEAGKASDGEEEIGFRDLHDAAKSTKTSRSAATSSRSNGINGHHSEDTFATEGDEDAPTRKSSMQVMARSWWRPTLMAIIVATTTVLSSFAEGWLGRRAEVHGEPSAISLLRYGTIPTIAAIIGYGTNVVALWMMFYPIKFFGYFPEAKIGCGLDLPLFGWQGVIPMRARDMAELTVDMMTEKLIKVDEVFSKLDPGEVAQEVSGILPKIVSEVVHDAGRRHCPKLWEYLPPRARKQLEERVILESGPMMASFIADLQANIDKCFDLKHCVVEKMVEQPELINHIFQTCGEKEFVFIRNSGFYLGFFFGLFQMFVWMYVKSWWILPVCGVFVGYFTNVVALKVIFTPIEPVRLCCGFKLQGLFLQRQKDVSALYGFVVAEKILCASVLMRAICSGPLCEQMFELVDKHVSKCMEDQAAYYKPMFLLAVGAETWVDFREGMCKEFRKRLPLLFRQIESYAQKKMGLEHMLRERLEKLPSQQYERLLHAVFEQDEIKLILVGALLGAIVGFLQAICQTPEQLGIEFGF